MFEKLLLDCLDLIVILLLLLKLVTKDGVKKHNVYRIPGATPQALVQLKVRILAQGRNQRLTVPVNPFNVT